MADIRYSTNVVDAFDRPPENPIQPPWLKPSNWDVAMRLEGSGFIHSTTANPSDQAFCYYDAESMNGDCEVWATATPDAPLHAAYYMGLVTDDSQGGYYLRNPHNVVNEPWEIWKLGVGMIASSDPSSFLIADQKVLMQISGSTISCYYSNDDGANWTLMISVNDTTYRQGLHLGLGAQDAGPGWDDVGGGPFDDISQIYRRPNE